MKFIVITRRPIDRAMSEYIEWSVQRKLSRSPQLPPFEPDGVERRCSTCGTSRLSMPVANEYHIRSWLQKFSERQMCYVDGDAFVTDPLEQIQSLESCMGLEPFFTDQNFVYNKKRGSTASRRGQTHIVWAEPRGDHTHRYRLMSERDLLSIFHHCNAHLSQLTGFEIGY